MNRPLRIAVFVGCFPVVSETFVLRQIGGLLGLGHEVDLYADTRAEPGAPVPEEVEALHLLERTTFMDMPPESAPWEMPVRPITGKTWTPGSATPVSNLSRLARALPCGLRSFLVTPRLAREALSPRAYGYRARSLSALYRLGRLASCGRRYDVLHAHFGPVGESFRFARKLWGAPFVVSFHGYDFSTAPRRESRDMYRRLFADADAVTVNSDYTRRQVEGLGCAPVKLHKVPMSVDLDAFAFRERVRRGPVRIATVARLVEIKGHEYCLRAVARLRERHPDIRYDLVGDGPLRPKLEALAGELHLGDTVAFHGAKAGDAVRAVLDGAHLFMLCSVSVAGDQEGQGLVLQEAQAAGLPVIATRHGALPEGLLPGESGFLVEERNVDALAERLRFLVEHPDCWPAMGRAGRRFVEANYSVAHSTRQLVELYVRARDEFVKPRAATGPAPSP